MPESRPADGWTTRRSEGPLGWGHVSLFGAEEPMSVYFTHQSALSFWRRYREFRHCRPMAVRADQYAGMAPSLLEIRDAAHVALPGDDELHVSVPEGARRAKARGLMRHRWHRGGERGSYVRVLKGVYVSSPAMLFLELAPDLRLEHLVELGYELCGGFTYSRGSGFCPCLPAVAPATLERFARAAVRSRGREKAVRAASLVLVGAASPREAHVAMLLTLPPRLGGYGLRRPELNGVVLLDEASRRILGKRSLRCDLLWSQANVALEYESDQFHAGLPAYVADSKRRNVLKHLGIDVITLTNAEIKSEAAMDGLASGLARALGQRVRGSQPQGQMAKGRLRGLLLDARQRAGAAHLLRADG